VKALSLTQPWATLVAIGAKRIETRSWSTPYRGPVAIHASKGFPRDCQQLCYEHPFVDVLLHRFNGPCDLPVGSIVAISRLTGVFPTARLAAVEQWIGGLLPHERAFGNYSRGRYGWLLSEVQALPEPICCKGALGLWTVPADIEARLR
jgi:activating signal cointegrator 1